MNDYSFLSKQEQTVLNLRKIYTDSGYKKQKPSKFESYDFYAKNKDFLVGNKILTFTDLNGKLMALKPDITLSIIKNIDPTLDLQKFYYTENVYRESKEIKEFKEIFQVGLEVFGKIDDETTVEIISLAIQSLNEIDNDCILEISDVGYIEGLLDCLTDDESLRNKIREMVGQKNVHDLNSLFVEHSLPKNPATVMCRILDSRLSNDDLLTLCENCALNGKMSEVSDNLKRIYGELKQNGLADKTKIDLSLTKDPTYYNSIVMEGYINSVPRAVLSGGRYDMLVKKMGKGDMKAMGFAIYFDALERLLLNKEDEE